jgi:hypothetical protein
MIDKYTNGYLKAELKDLPNIKRDLIGRFKEICLKDYGVKVKVKVKLIPIEPELGFNYKYQIRCKG